LSETEVVARIREQCGWPLAVSTRLTKAPAPRREDLLRLRLYDIRNDFLDFSTTTREQEGVR